MNGLNGKDGINGKDGKDGKNGINGLNGKDGKDGKDGRDGKDSTGGVYSPYPFQFLVRQSTEWSSQGFGTSDKPSDYEYKVSSKYPNNLLKSFIVKGPQFDSLTKLAGTAS